MKISHGFIALLILVYCAIGIRVVNAQERILSEEEFNKITTGASRLSFDGPFREHSFSQHFEKSYGSQPIMTIESTYEAVSNERTRTLSIVNQNGKVERTEIVQIGRDRYERKDDRLWQENQQLNRLTVLGKENLLRKKEFTFRFLGEVNRGDKTADMYESRKLREYEGASAYTIIDQYWILNDGKLLRIETTQTESDGYVSFRMCLPTMSIPKDLL